MHQRTLIVLLIVALLVSLAATVYLAWRLHETRDRLDALAWEAFGGALGGLDAIDADLSRMLEQERAGEEDVQFIRRKAVAFAADLEEVMRLARRRGAQPDVAVDPVVAAVMQIPERLETTLAANGRPVGGRAGSYIIEGLAWSDFVDVRTMVRRLRDTGRRILAEEGLVPDTGDWTAGTVVGNATERQDEIADPANFLRQGVWARVIEEMAAGLW